MADSKFQLEQEIKDSFLHKFGRKREVAIRVLEDEGDSAIVRVLFPVPNLCPIPYRNIRYDKPTQEFFELSSRDYRSYQINPYK